MRELVLAARERWDGSGHPRGLRGEEIPIGGRILSVVRAYTRLRRGGTFRSPRTRDEACADLGATAGSDLDPAVVGTLARIVRDARSDT
jgi:response regulator RpfG family c-di-GMP phosphodiesterase